ncbi:MAG: PEGA domain-containing protein [Candidatus Magasanikbacteria bacterium]|nr:PEGA domain-containing protein [Candidatus Magasanikbacteria bacterium]
MIVAIGIFALFVLGIYGGTQIILKVVYQSRITILESAILNEEIEIVHNLAFHDLGLVGGNPLGVLDRTSTSSRNGIDFVLTRTVRNIDDSFDGLIGGNPNDTAPADYKLVVVEVSCASCRQTKPLSVQTTIAPQYLEGDPDHGALFISVFDAEAVPVQGASVHITATSTDTPIDLVDTTDKNGKLRLLDLGFGTRAYGVVVSKTGYITDQTMMPTDEVSNPSMQPLSVVAGDLTEESFFIDKVSSISISTLDLKCDVEPYVELDIQGTKLLGTNPDILKFDREVETDGAGLYTFQNVEWDAYAVFLEDYDLIGSIPPLPFTLLPGIDQPVRLVVGKNTKHSLLVTVRDSVTLQPLSNALVRMLKSGANDKQFITGLGSLRQSDWSLGGGQQFMDNEQKYWADDAGVDTQSPAGDLKLAKIGQFYVSDGELESSVFDTGFSVEYVNLIWEPANQPEATSLKFQIATAASATSTEWNYLGPDGTPNTFYTTGYDSLSSAQKGNRYLRYKVYLHSDLNTETPVLSDVSFTFVNGCVPPGQAYASLASGDYTVEVEKEGYQNYSTTVNVENDVSVIVDMVSQGN